MAYFVATINSYDLVFVALVIKGLFNNDLNWPETCGNLSNIIMRAELKIVHFLRRKYTIFKNYFVSK